MRAKSLSGPGVAQPGVTGYPGPSTCCVGAGGLHLPARSAFGESGVRAEAGTGVGGIWPGLVGGRGSWGEAPQPLLGPAREGGGGTGPAQD